MQLKEIHVKVHSWYAKYGRHDLPWRNSNDAYEIYLSEVMLQQTQVKTVLERYYFQFLDKFPSLDTLSNAKLDDVLKMWEGLGYYTRARNLHACAKLAAPKLPREYDALLKLPGIGKNTASAICAFAYHQPLAIMEANVKRILSRIHGFEWASDRVLQDAAYALLDKENPYDYNQAMMDIGATLCTIKNPGCSLCPFSTICQAYDEGYFLYPLKKRKIVPTRVEKWLVLTADNRLKLTKREGKFLHGLWGFEKLKEGDSLSSYIGEVRQTYTHFKQVVEIYHDRASRGNNYFTVEEIEMLALSGIDKKIVNLLKIKKIL